MREVKKSNEEETQLFEEIDLVQLEQIAGGSNEPEETMTKSETF